MYIVNALTGKLHHTVDESEDSYKQQFANEELTTDTFHFNKKLKTEAMIRQQAEEEGGLESPINCVFDQAERFVMYGCMMGVKIVNVCQMNSRYHY